MWFEFRYAPVSAIDVTRPIYKFLSFGAIDVTKPYTFIKFGAMDVTQPYKFIRFGAIHVTKPYEIYKFWGPRCHQTL